MNSRRVASPWIPEINDANNISEGFRISGLGQLIEGGIEADRTVVFGD